MAAFPAQPELDNATSPSQPNSNRIHLRDATLQRPSGVDTGMDRRNSGASADQLAVEKNPELLHWRANRLLDEMMLGAIDVAANDSVPARALASSRPQYSSVEMNEYTTADSHSDSSFDGRTRQRPFRHTEHRDQYQQDGADGSEVPDVYGSRPARNVAPSSASDVGNYGQHAFLNDRNATGGADTYAPAPPLSHPHSGQSSGGAIAASEQRASVSRFDPSGPEPVADRGLAGNTRSSLDTRDAHKGARRAASGAPLKQVQPRNGTEQWLFAAEQRYEQLAVRQQAQQRGDGATGYDYDGWSMADTSATELRHQGVAVPYRRENNFEQLPAYGQEEVKHQAALKQQQVVSPVEVTVGKAGRKNLRSNLLPRMSAPDSRSVQQEMAMLQNSIETTLSEQHESRVRAQNLLVKAATIMQNDPSRSAEVEYYLQQVRTIVKRVQESVQWSELYKKRLRTYLLGWLALSLIVIVSRYLYAGSLSAFLGRMTGQGAAGLVVYNLLTLVTAFFFGALGGGVGALLNFVRHIQQGYGFFDRKYGLRGLILPIIGALCGLALCVVFGILYTLLGVEPMASFWFGLVPALLAMLLGASQEHFYGTVAP